MMSENTKFRPFEWYDDDTRTVWDYDPKEIIKSIKRQLENASDKENGIKEAVALNLDIVMKAVNEITDIKEKKAINSAIVAMYMAGVYADLLAKTLTDGFLFDNEYADLLKQVRSKKSQYGLNIRHAENRDMKTQALTWYAENKHNYKSKNDAAYALIKIVPVKFGTARNWLKDQ